jgi:teichuronic acid exporter
MNLPIISRLINVEFFKNVSTMLVGSFISQLLPVLASPILTRIYNPQNFGAFAFFLSSCTVITILATGYYEIAILKLKKHKEVINLCFVITLISFSISLLIFLTLIFLTQLKIELLNSMAMTDFILIPLGIFLNSLFQITTYYLTWKSKFVFLNQIKIFQSITIVIASIGLGYSPFKNSGLIVSYILGFLVSAIPIIYNIYSFRKFIAFGFANRLIKEYRTYPMYALPSAFINNLASQLPIFFIKKYFEKASVGEYSLTNRILIAPVSLISVSLGQVYFKKISDKSNKKESLKKSFYDTFSLLSAVSILIFTPLFFWGEVIVVFVFGKEWIMAGKLSEILSVAVLIKFIVSPLSTIFFAINATSALTKWQVIYFCSSILLFLIITNNLHFFLTIYVIHEVILYCLYFVMMVNSLRKYEKNL